MEYHFPNLCKPITIGRVTFRNRIFSAPMGGTDITNDGCIGPKSTAFYELRAKGGAGAVTISECMVHPQTDGSHAYHLFIVVLYAPDPLPFKIKSIPIHVGQSILPEQPMRFIQIPNNRSPAFSG